LPSRLQQRENNAVEIRFSHGWQQANPIPRETAADGWDFLFARRWLQVWILVVDLREQIQVQSADNSSKQFVEGQPFLFSEVRDSMLA
jgi:hypothetical protein